MTDFVDESPKYYMSISGKNFEHHPYRIVLGPWKTESEASAYSDGLTDTRIGEQLITKLGVEDILVFEG